MARTGGGPGDAGGATMFLVDADNPGMKIVRNHDEILERYGAHTTAQMDAAMPLLREFVNDHLGYYVFLLRKPR
ncbi:MULTISPECIES: hypothetical protein [unclassified Streptomyces]|uniref:hypothetical protein n=1 Tax=unclassified Streptomyces TaxID=2593676 RepID=UPI0036A24E2A